MEMTINIQNGRGVALAMINNERAGAMTFTIPNEEFIIIDHTEVDSKFKGQNVGKELLNKIVEMAREKKIKIMPLCPFAHAVFQKTPAIQDVLKK